MVMRCLHVCTGLLQGGGIATSLNASGQQWDAPNAWAPLQSIMVDGLTTYGGMLHRRAWAASGTACLQQVTQGRHAVHTACTWRMQALLRGRSDMIHAGKCMAKAQATGG